MTVFNRRSIGPKPRRTRAQMIAAAVAALVVVLVIAEVITDAVNDSPQVGKRALASWAAGVEPVLSASSTMGQAVCSIDDADASMTRAALDATLDELLNYGTDAPRPTARQRKVDLPLGLTELKHELNLSDDDVEMLAGVNFRGHRPRDKEGWRYLLETLRMLSQRKLER